MTTRARSRDGGTLLHKAAYRGEARLCVALLQTGLFMADDLDEWNQPPVYYACKRGHVEVVKLLLAAKSRRTEGAGSEKESSDSAQATQTPGPPPSPVPQPAAVPPSLPPVVCALPQGAAAPGDGQVCDPYQADSAFPSSSPAT